MLMSQVARWFDPEKALIRPVASMRRQLPISNMFLIKSELGVYTRQHPESPVYDASQGDGGATLSGIRPDELANALVLFLPNTQTTAYGSPNGSLRVRQALLENFWKLDRIGLTPDNILVTDGGRDALQKWYQAIHMLTGKIGLTVVTSAAPWVSYAHGTYVNGFNLLCAPAQSKTNLRMTPDGITACLGLCGTADALIITTPDNPTGAWYSPNEIKTLIERARFHGIKYILIDLMYQLVIDDDVPLYDWAEILGSFSAEDRACVTLLDGLTKSVGASNVRMAHLACGDEKFAKTIQGIASHTVLPNVLGEACALEVYSSSDVRNHPWVKRITKRTSASRNIFRREMTARGYTSIADQGYYAFVDVTKWLGRGLRPDQFFNGALANTTTHIETVKDLGSYLACEHGIAVVHGTPFLQPNFIRFSYAQDPAITIAAINRFDEALKSIP
ncbi:hypothetical protein A3C09_00715 [Candidatus Uhrbacteria bacterium RIFCSPHIGHO2_02_FULL_47_44]|uniref:Aminotransferase class I/classII large domain-containing protein n=1 Tax=Candidatus Uhrbacteria bacterium RIFCSPLOWO2_02_FULL_48_18 TaxID=1802408 RepID=A0A1F7VAE6_9BACT|nr:MAG: hypothetical protein A2839_02530 [Candidatus Uhrbacteria bacterium RIFCSPHIGHO2_01_FULL_47_10]OGL69710.1 MAG: hypothetical protein A3C09_00715 [Candidatus Uhrbacteria bacterium RIFCSPHIGHO2_02_FULL_47_44]OGL77482.1 MAG: hypothetical protein A3E97_00700 [Candidatus Uhrbacteria bacterium RIFCSPHIGHO2_12_FULL_47_12]OGL81844.1 MAG: hypothetical protein A3B20_02005 [Candidatus Uhrbacteria bacterium RIFCSPLOWO2_01_FULL_47_17]OGL87007.1 MAG: hypothetical protein A3I41_03595 [Candidatus Uhrbact